MGTEGSGNPTFQFLGIVDEAYDSRLSEQLPMDRRIGMPDRPSSIRGADVTPSAAGSETSSRPPIRAAEPYNEEQVEQLEDHRDRKSPRP
jgi:hypothetical protein